MERETTSFKTPVSQQEVVIKSWLTGREKRKIQEVYLNEMSFKGGEDASYDLRGELVNKAQDVAIQTVVVSVDGKAENILDILLDMRGQDFDFVVEQINKITASSSLTEEAKKK